MYPMQWFWSPQLYFPWSGKVEQEIELDRFFNAIPTWSGDGAIERRAFDVASYGRQLGWLSDILLDMAQQVMPQSPVARESLRKLAAASEEIGQLKRRIIAVDMQYIEDALRTLRDTNLTQFLQSRERLMLLLTPPPDDTTPQLE